jgi:two-component system, sensor histidine kinase and response regulator
MMSKMKILIADDEPANLFLLKGLLENEYHLETAANGKESLKKAQAFMPDLILLDIMMPEINGIDVCKKLTSKQQYKDIPIILLTAKVSDEDVQTGLDAGAIDYIKKPFSDVELNSRITSALKLRKYILKLKELNTIKDRFVSIVSHDLRSPLSSIITYSELLLDDEKIKSNDEHRELISTINKAGKRQSKLIENLLNLSLSESGKMKIYISNFNLSTAITEITTEIKFKLSEKQISLSLDVPDNVVVYADEQRIKQVIANLLNNAIKFTAKNGNISLLLTEKEKQFQIAIQDSGVGIEVKKQKKLFNSHDIYTTLGTKGEKGTGLGLKICARIIKSHNGKIQVKSKKNKGSTFCFTINKKLKSKKCC